MSKYLKIVFQRFSHMNGGEIFTYIELVETKHEFYNLLIEAINNNINDFLNIFYNIPYFKEIIDNKFNDKSDYFEFDFDFKKKNSDMVYKLLYFTIRDYIIKNDIFINEHNDLFKPVIYFCKRVIRLLKYYKLKKKKKDFDIKKVRKNLYFRFNRFLYYILNYCFLEKYIYDKSNYFYMDKYDKTVYNMHDDFNINKFKKLLFLILLKFEYCFTYSSNFSCVMIMTKEKKPKEIYKYNYNIANIIIISEFFKNFTCLSEMKVTNMFKDMDIYDHNFIKAGLVKNIDTLIDYCYKDNIKYFVFNLNRLDNMKYKLCINYIDWNSITKDEIKFVDYRLNCIDPDVHKNYVKKFIANNEKIYLRYICPAIKEIYEIDNLNYLKEIITILRFLGSIDLWFKDNISNKIMVIYSKNIEIINLIITFLKDELDVKNTEKYNISFLKFIGEDSLNYFDLIYFLDINPNRRILYFTNLEEKYFKNHFKKGFKNKNLKFDYHYYERHFFINIEKIFEIFYNKLDKIDSKFLTYYKNPRDPFSNYIRLNYLAESRISSNFVKYLWIKKFKNILNDKNIHEPINFNLLK